MGTIRDLANAGVFGTARMVAGAAGISRTVRRVHISEILDDYSIFQENDLVVSTGYGLENQNGLQETAIREIAQKNVSGIVFKLGQYLNGLCEAALDAADNLAMPIFLAGSTFSTTEFTAQVTLYVARDLATNSKPSPWSQMLGAGADRFGREAHVVVALGSNALPLTAANIVTTVTEGDVHYVVLLCGGSAARTSIAADASEPVGISSLGRCTRDLERQRREAETALRIARLFKTRQTFWEEAEPFYLLGALLEHMSIDSFTEPLLRHIRALGYEDTVVAFCSEPSLAATAAHLGIHRNTLAYRLDRLQVEVGLPLTRPLVRRWLDWAIWFSQMRQTD